MEHDDLQIPANADDFHSACSTPFSAPSSPVGTPSGFFYSAPASPIHFMLSSSSTSSYSASAPIEGANSSFEFEFTAKEAAVGTPPSGFMSSADELFLNGQIRPVNVLSPLHEIDNEEDRGRYRSKSLRRRARSMSPMRTSSDDHFQWLQQQQQDEDLITEQNSKIKIDQAVAIETTDNNNNETTPSGVSSRSNRWIFIKEFLYRSKSEGRSSTSSNSNSNSKFWTSLSFSSPINEKKTAKLKNKEEGITAVKKKAVNGVEIRRVGRSAHERHYTMNRAQTEEMRKKTYLPYKQGLLGCLGFSSKSYGAMNGFARALNPVSSR
ncbi:uncharacterized protein [Rutidosis leptorrhynchoides]|uniref:uncharacterized protein n=1 Tax=Rutidosis leptorrhynchoides TaxID=125765 RepID=UPI003A99DFCE